MELIPVMFHAQWTIIFEQFEFKIFYGHGKIRYRPIGIDLSGFESQIRVVSGSKERNFTMIYKYLLNALKVVPHTMEKGYHSFHHNFQCFLDAEYDYSIHQFKAYICDVMSLCHCPMQNAIDFHVVLTFSSMSS